MGLIYLDRKDFTLQAINLDSPKLGKKPSGPMVLFIKAEWCGHCIRYLPHYETFSKQFPKTKFLVLDSDGEGVAQMFKHWNELAHPVFQVNGFPTVVIYDEEGNPMHVVENRFALDQELKK